MLSFLVGEGSSFLLANAYKYVSYPAGQLARMRDDKLRGEWWDDVCSLWSSTVRLLVLGSFCLLELLGWNQQSGKSTNYRCKSIVIMD